VAPQGPQRSHPGAWKPRPSGRGGRPPTALPRGWPIRTWTAWYGTKDTRLPSPVPGRADGYPSGPPTDPYVRNARIRFLKQSLCYPPQSTGVLVSGLVSSTSLPCVLPADALPDGAFPPVGRLGVTSPPSLVLCAATTAALPISGSFTCRWFPDTLPAPVVCGLPLGLAIWWKPQVTPGPLVTRSPTPGLWSRRQAALPSSRVPPLKTCPALRPRWCPAHLP
jgi:hypothetical protein